MCADGLYGSLNLLRRFLRREICGVIIMPQYLLKCYPFVASSGFDVRRMNEEVDTYYNICGDKDKDSDEDE